MGPWWEDLWVDSRVTALVGDLTTNEERTTCMSRTEVRHTYLVGDLTTNEERTTCMSCTEVRHTYLL